MLQMYAYEKEADGTFYMEAEIDTDQDAFLLQRLFRNALQVNMGIESTFGYGRKFKEVLEMDYYRNARFRLAFTLVDEREAIMVTLVEPVDGDKEKRSRKQR